MSDSSSTTWCISVPERVAWDVMFSNAELNRSTTREDTPKYDIDVAWRRAEYMPCLLTFLHGHTIPDDALLSEQKLDSPRLIAKIYTMTDNEKREFARRIRDVMKKCTYRSAQGIATTGCDAKCPGCEMPLLGPMPPLFFQTPPASTTS